MRYGRLRRLLFCALLEVGVLAGMPMRPEEIRELMQTLHRPKIVHVLPLQDEDEGARDPGHP